MLPVFTYPTIQPEPECLSQSLSKLLTLLAAASHFHSDRFFYEAWMRLLSDNSSYPQTEGGDFQVVTTWGFWEAIRAWAFRSRQLTPLNTALSSARILLARNSESWTFLSRRTAG